MHFLTAALGGWIALLLCGCAHGVVADTQATVSTEFVGTTPGDEPVRYFLGGLATNAQCHSITWKITMFTNQDAGRPKTFRLTALYQVPKRSNPNQSESGPKVDLHGTWQVGKGAKARPDAAVYRFTAAQPERSLSFVKLGDGLLHLLNPDATLAVGNGGWSYTLNRSDRAEKPGDASQLMNAPEMSYKISPMATGPSVFGVFEGRSPCQGISRELRLPQHAGCIKSKWRLTLYQNPETSKPTIYKVEGSLFREAAREGTWDMVRATAVGSDVVVYQMNPTQTQLPLCLLKGDDNVLFFLDQKRELLVGHSEFSYTLNRVKK